MKLSWTWQKVSVPATNMVLQLFNLFKIFSSLLPDFYHLVLFLNLKNWYASWTNLSSSFTWRLRKVSLLVDQSDNFDGWLISRMNLRKVRLLDGQSDIFSDGWLVSWIILYDTDFGGRPLCILLFLLNHLWCFEWPAMRNIKHSWYLASVSIHGIISLKYLWH